MNLPERTWQVRYVKLVPEVSGSTDGLFLATPSDGKPQEVTVRLTDMLSRFMEKEHEIDPSDIEHLIIRLGAKAILAQLEERGEVDEMILLSDWYPGHPERPDLDKNCRHLERPPGKMLCRIAASRDKWLGMTNLRTCEMCNYPFLTCECRHLVNAETMGFVRGDIRQVVNEGCALGQPDFQLRTCPTRECFDPLPISFRKPEERRRLGFLGER